MTAEPTSLKPNTRPNFVLAAMALGLMMGWLALDLARVLGRNAVPRDYGFLAAITAIAVLLMAASYWLFTNPFGARSSITFTDAAIVFDHSGLLGGTRRFAIPRSEIVAFWVVDAPYTRQFSVELTPAQAIVFCLWQPSTRQDSAFVSAPKLRFNAYGFHDPMPVVIDALRADLSRAGLTLGRVNAGRTLPIGQRWPVIKA